MRERGGGGGREGEREGGKERERERDNQVNLVYIAIEHNNYVTVYMKKGELSAIKVSLKVLARREQKPHE